MDQLNIRDERSARAKHTRRQTVLSGRKGKTYADFIEPTSGLNVVAIANNTDPIIATFSDGFDKNGYLDYTTFINSNISFNNLYPNANNYLGIKRYSNGIIEPVISNSKPIYGSVFGNDRENKICATFNGATNSTRFVDFYGNIFNCYNLSSFQAGHPSGSGNSLRFNGGASYAEVDLSLGKINFSMLNTWTIEFWFKLDNAAVTNQTIFLSTFDNGISVIYENSTTLRFKAGDGSTAYVNMIVNNSGPTIVSGVWYKVVLMFIGRGYRVLMNDGGVTPLKLKNFNIVRLPTGERVTSLNFLRLGLRKNGSGPMQGNISDFALWPYIKYPQRGDNIGDVVTTASTLPIQEDSVEIDRYLYVKNRFHVDLSESNVDTESYRDVYGNDLIFRRTTAATNPYIESTPGPTGFGTVNAIRLRNHQDSVVEFNNLDLNDRFTLECWVRFSNVSTVQLIFSGGEDEWSGFRFRTNSNNSQFIVDFSLTGESWNIHTGSVFNWSGGNISVGQWYHFALSYDGNTYRFFRDGLQQWSYTSIALMFKPRNIVFGGHPEIADWSLDGSVFGMSLFPYCKYNGGFVPPQSFDGFKEKLYYYDISLAKMFYGYRGDWQEEKVLFIGEATTNNSAVEHCITYSINGECYISGITSFGEGIVSNAAMSFWKMTLGHFIGTDMVKVDYWVTINESFGWKKIGEKLKPLAHDNVHQVWPISINDSNYFSFHNLVNGIIIPFNTNVINFSPVDDRVEFQFRVERDF